MKSARLIFIYVECRQSFPYGIIHSDQGHLGVPHDNMPFRPIGQKDLPALIILNHTHRSTRERLIVAAARGDVPDRFHFAIAHANELVPAVDHYVLLPRNQLELVAYI